MQLNNRQLFLLELLSHYAGDMRAPPVKLEIRGGVYSVFLKGQTFVFYDHEMFIPLFERRFFTKKGLCPKAR